MKTSLSHQRALFGIFAILALGLGVLGYWIYAREEQAIREARFTELHAIAELKVNQIAAWRRERLNDARLNSSGIIALYVRQWFRESPDDGLKPPILARLHLLQEAHQYQNILIVGKEGRLLLLSLEPRLNVLETHTKRLAAEALSSRDAVFGEFFRCSLCNQVHLDVAAPIPGEDNRPAAVLILRSDPEQYLYPLIQSWPTPSRTAETLLIRREGHDALFLNRLRHRPDPPLTFSIPLSQADVPAIQAAQGITGRFMGRDYRGVSVLADIRPVPDSPWFMVAKVDTEEILAETRYRAGAIGLATLALLLLTALGAALIYKHQGKRAFEALYQAERGRREAQEEIRSTLYGIGDGVIATDASGCVRRMNPVAEALTGWSEEEALGKPLKQIFSILNEFTRAEVQNPVELVIREGRVVGIANHTLLISRDGTERPIADSGAPIRNEDGTIAGVALVFRDQTEERQRLEALRASEELMRSVLRVAPTGIGMVKDRIIVELNRRVCEMTGYSREELIGANARMLYPTQEEFDYVGTEKYRQIEAFGTGTVETQWVKKDGGIIDVLLSSTPIDLNDLSRGVTFTALDISERKRAQEEILRQNALTKAINRVLHETLHSESDAEVAETCLAVAEELTGSKFGWIGDVNSAGRLDTIAMSNPSWDSCSMSESHSQPVIRNMEVNGIWGRVLTDGKSLLSNDPPSHPDWKGLPQGHPEITSFLGVPLKHAGRTVGMIALANRIKGYTPEDQAAIETLSVALVEALNRKRAEEERQKLQEQLMQAQKMESVGRLAGGVAHDFNNMLGVILGHAELGMMRANPREPLHADLEEIRKAAARSGDLVRQLLAFARKETVSPRVLDLNDAVSGMTKMLRRLIGEEIDLVWIPGHELWPVKMDPSQVDQLLANIAVNARDAINGVGVVTIETENVVLDGAYCEDHLEGAPGDYVMLAISDSGCGMDKETAAKIFEPFFTTKAVGHGTGLGLSTVYGIVKQNDGLINVYSEPGQGTTFKIYLPRFAVESDQAGPGAVEEPLCGGTETLLIVEDEESILNLGKAMLEGLGYAVLTAMTPGEALQVAKDHDGEIHLLITDVVMPEMNGRELAERLCAIKPEMKCLYMSGYTADIIAHRGVLEDGLNFIQKPFTLRSLAAKVRTALGGK